MNPDDTSGNGDGSPRSATSSGDASIADRDVSAGDASIAGRDVQLQHSPTPIPGCQAEENKPVKAEKSNDANGTAAAVSFAEVLARELRAIDISRARCRGIADQTAVAPEEAAETARRRGLLGVALSGGGIRSATFNLGVLQALTRSGWLRHIDYLSTVSGGGYIATWLVAWLKRTNLKGVEKSLGYSIPVPIAAGSETAKAKRRASAVAASEPVEVAYLRCFSNYLTPRIGMFGGDTWSVIASYVRNLLLNLLVLLLVVAACQTLPLVWTDVFGEVPGWVAEWTFLILLQVALIAFVINVSKLVDDRSPKGARTFNAGPRGTWLFIVLPFLLSCWFLATALRVGAATPFGLPYGFARWHALLWLIALTVRWALDLWEVANCSKAESWPAAGKRFWIASWAQMTSGREEVVARFRAAIKLVRSQGAGLRNDAQSRSTMRARLWRVIQVGGAMVIKTVATLASTDAWKSLWLIIAAGLSGVAGGWMLLKVHRYAEWMYSSSDGVLVFAALGPVAVFGALELMLVLQFGLAGDCLSDEAHEWCSRMVGAKVRVCLLWLVIVLNSWVGFKVAEGGPNMLIRWMLLPWVTLTAAAALAGAVARRKRRSARVAEGWTQLTAAIFLAGLVVAVSALVWRKVAVIGGLQEGESTPPVLLIPPVAVGEEWNLITGWHETVGSSGILEFKGSLLSLPLVPIGPAWMVDVDRHKAVPPSKIAEIPWLRRCPVWLQWLMSLVLIGGVALLLAWRIGVNRFSMHSVYRNRLVRCYLGASRPNRDPNPYTQFDPEDNDWRLADLSSITTSYSGPYLLLNCAMNLVGGDNLAWQKRKAASFIFSPEYCGFEIDPDKDQPLRERIHGKLPAAGQDGLAPKGYRPTLVAGPCVKEPLGYADRLSLGSAMTISGAAANPNMGHFSSPALTMLMTVLNARLGWWFGNPRSNSHWTKRDPGMGLFYLGHEMFGRTDDCSNYVQLSDGGHFENLGIYELVRRRCRFIIASDATEDHRDAFADLGNAIEKCRTDFGIAIEIDIAPLRQDAAGRSARHCAVGVIRYDLDQQNPGGQRGTLLYLKASLTGDEPTDILRYDAQHPEFPHQPTSNQWFDESQFESYRVLGDHIVDAVLGKVTEKRDARPDVARVFQRLSERYRTPNTAAQKAFTQHTRTYDQLCVQMRQDSSLQFLDAQFFPSWDEMMKDADVTPASGGLWLPKNPEQRRAGYYFCCQLIQLMENVYLDLNLEDERDHLDNRGWMNLFQNWTRSGMFRLTWAMAACGYGKRFQLFCERQFKVLSGKVEATEWRKDTVSNLRALSSDGMSGILTNREQNELKKFLKLADKTLKVSIFILRQIVSDLNSDAENDEQAVSVGFAVQSDTELVYFRIRRSFRQMGFARKGVEALVLENPKLSCNEEEQQTEEYDGEDDGFASGGDGGERWEPRRFNELIESVKAECKSRLDKKACQNSDG